MNCQRFDFKHLLDLIEFIIKVDVEVKAVDEKLENFQFVPNSYKEHETPMVYMKIYKGSKDFCTVSVIRFTKTIRDLGTKGASSNLIINIVTQIS